MLKIECDANDLVNLMDQILTDKTELSRVRQEKYCLEDKVSELEQKVSAQATMANPINIQQEIAYLVKAMYNHDKIGVIKAVRTMTGMGLKEVKDLVENASGVSWSMPEVNKY